MHRHNGSYEGGTAANPYFAQERKKCSYYICWREEDSNESIGVFRVISCLFPRGKGGSLLLSSLSMRDVEKGYFQQERKETDSVEIRFIS